MHTWSQFLLQYYTQLQPPTGLPQGVSWLFPQQQPAVQQVLQQFLNQYYNDSRQRTLLLGINPGRLGAGITGVNFTAPRQLRQYCNIAHPFKDGTEISAEFVYEVIQAYGGVHPFYQHYFIGSVCPLGFTKNGRNINYYDDRELLRTVQDFIVSSLQQLVSFCVNRHVCICIGGEKNYWFLSTLNQQYGWFQRLVPLPHPRFVMQYRRKDKQSFIDNYLDVLQKN